MQCFPLFCRVIPVSVLLFLIPLLASAQKDTIGSGRLEFTENKGQWEKEVRYKADIGGGAMFLSKGFFTFAFRDQDAVHDLMHFKYLGDEKRKLAARPQDIVRYHAYRVTFNGCNPDVQIEARGETPDFVNYYLGSDPEKWASSVKKYTRLQYQSLYPGVDLRIYEKDFLLKYDFLLQAGADPGQISIEYSGIDDLSLVNDNLYIKTSVNQVIELKPFAYQDIDGNRKEVSCRFRVRGNQVSFKLGSYDRQHPLVIDPVLIFSSYSGSTADNWGYTATYDSKGFLYAGGNVFGVGYPVTLGAYQISYGGASCDIAISKYDTTGHTMIYSTYLGGSGTEVPNSLIVDSYDQLFVLGTTSSSDYPVTANAYDQTYNGGTAYTLTYVLNYTGSDIVVTKFNSSGTGLIASTFLGGTGNDGLNTQAPLRYNYADDVRGEIMIDVNNNIYIASTTASTDFPITAGSFQQTHAGGTQDGLLVKMDNNLTNIIWSSYLGGSGNDAVYSILVDHNEDIYVAGGTTSTNFPTTPGVLKPSYQGGSSDGYITHIAGDGSQIMHSTYWGSSVYDQTYFVENDNYGNIYTLGQTSALGNYWVTNAAWYITNGGQFISKMNSRLDTLVWSTAWGTGNGGPDVSPTAFLVDLCDKIYLSAWGGSVNSFGGTTGLPVTGGAFQTTTDGSDYYFMVIKDDASALDYASFFGGSSSEHVDGGTSRFDRMGRIYQSVCAGCGGISDFPTTPGAVSNTNNSFNCNNGVIKLDFMLPIIVADFALPPVVCAPSNVMFDNTSVSGGPGFTSQWYFGDGTGSNQFEPTHLYTSSGTYYVTLIVQDTGTCNFADSITRPLLVLSNSVGWLPEEHICPGDNIQIGIPPTGDPTITYAWTPASTLTDPTISNPYASPAQTTTYTVYVSNGVCTDTLWQTVTVHALEAWPYGDTTTCTGLVNLTANSSGGATSFHWSSNPQFTDWLNSSPMDSSMSQTITGPATFYIMVSNNWCSAVDSVQVAFAVITGAPAIQQPLCHDDCNGMASVVPQNGTAPFSYSWSTGSSNDTIFNLCAGTYSVTITDGQSCIAIQTIDLINPTPLTHTLSVFNNPCEEVCVGTINLNVSGSTPPYQFLWNNGQTGNPATGLCTGGPYVVTITDSHNCTSSDSAMIIMDYVFAGLEVWADDDTIYEGQTTGLHATPINGCTYNWSPAQYVANNGSANTMVNPPVTTTFYLSILDPYGCEYTDTITIYVIDVICDEPYIYIPNAFTPNGDNKNDLFYLRTQQANDIYLVVFDRWGEKVFETYDQSVGWDGTFRGKALDPGVFVYYCEVICLNNEMFVKKGNVTLIR